MAYAALNGLTFSAIFLVYTRASIAQTFFATAGTFGAMSFYGYTTKRDLPDGRCPVDGADRLLIGSLINFFRTNSALYGS